MTFHTLCRLLQCFEGIVGNSDDGNNRSIHFLQKISSILILFIRKVVIQIIEIMLTLFIAWWNGHIVTIEFFEILIRLFHTTKYMTFKIHFLGISIHRRGHNAPHPKIMIHHQLLRIVSVFFLQLQQSV